MEPAGGQPRRSGVKRHLLTLFAVVGIAVLSPGCTATTNSSNPSKAETLPTDGSIPGSAESPSTASPATSRVEVETNHCFVEPVAFDGERWNVPFNRQFGWGGMEPRSWQGAGVMTRVSDDRARFRDDGGSTVGFRPVKHRSVRPVETAGCD